MDSGKFERDRYLISGYLIGGYRISARALGDGLMTVRAVDQIGHRPRRLLRRPAASRAISRSQQR